MSFKVIVTYKRILKRHIHTSVSWSHFCRLGRTIVSRRSIRLSDHSMSAAKKEEDSHAFACEQFCC